MEKTIEQLESYRGKGDYCYELGEGPNPDNPQLGNPESGIRYLNGKIEVWHKDATVSKDWSLDDQIAYIKRYIVANETEVKMAEIEGDWKRIQCVIHQLNAIIPPVKAGEFDSVKVGGTTIKNFVSPSAEDRDAWVEALELRVAEDKGKAAKLQAEYDVLEEKLNQYNDEDEVLSMSKEVKDMVDNRNASINDDNAIKSDAPKDDTATVCGTFKNPALQNDSVSKADTSKKDGATKNATEQGIPSKTVATRKDVDVTEDGYSVAFYAEYVKVESRVVHEGTTKAKKAKGKAGSATGKDHEKIMVISVVQAPVYKGPTPGSDDTSSTGNMGSELVFPEIDADRQAIPVPSPLDMLSDDEGLLADKCSDDDDTLTEMGMDSEDEGIIPEAGTVGESEGTGEDASEPAEGEGNSVPLCRGLGLAFSGLVVFMVGVLPFMFIFIALKVLVIGILQAHGLFEDFFEGDI